MLMMNINPHSEFTLIQKSCSIVTVISPIQHQTIYSVIAANCGITLHNAWMKNLLILKDSLSVRNASRGKNTWIPK